MSEVSKRIRVIAGPNGSGKSTLLHLIQSRVRTGPYVNADDISKMLIEKKVLNLLSNFGIATTEKSYEQYMNQAGISWTRKAQAEGLQLSLKFEDNNLLIHNISSIGYNSAVAADFIRHELIEMQKSFTFETVLSHRSKLDFLRSATERGYKIYLYFVSTVSPQININRIKQRVKKGGHHVDDKKVTDRYELSLRLLPELARMAHRSYIFDNSEENSQIKLFAEVNNQQQIFIPDEYLPWWVVERVIKPLFESHHVQVK